MMNLRLPSVLGLVLDVVVGSVGAARAAESSDTLVVSPSGPYTSIRAALEEAEEGMVIEVRGGEYSGSLIINKAVTLRGVDWPVIDGGGKGTVVTLSVPGSSIYGFEVRGSGSQPDGNDAGILMTASHTTAENNRLTDVLFGIFVAQADDAVVRGNHISSKLNYDLGRKGDGIRVWYSQRVTVEGNQLREVRDVVAWYSSEIILRDNLIEEGRYGIHLMYCDGAVIDGNRILNNSVGIYVMYSNDLALHENIVKGQRGPSGYALAFKDTNNVEASGNILADNRAGFFLDGTPFAPQTFARFEDNILAFNDIGVVMQPAVRGSQFTGNSFWENIEQVAIMGGGGTAAQNSWEGNFWSDYTGFDSDGDGVGDLPYHSERLMENLYDREERLRALIFSPAAQAIEFAASTFPVMRPQIKLEDASPLVNPPLISQEFAQTEESDWSMTVAALFATSIGLAGGVMILVQERMTAKRNGFTTAPVLAPTHTLSSLSVEGVSKRYGKLLTLDNLSFRAEGGEAVALWGPNGAGKTTLLKTILGLVVFDGRVEVCGVDAYRQGKLARRHIGYVAQEAVFYDWTVTETVDFYARLKKAAPGRAVELLDRLNLTAHAKKRVPALSGGLKQRLALAVALLSDPPILLLDEPTANLDIEACRDYLGLLAALRAEGKLILFASHRQEEIDLLADRVLVLEQGKLALDASPEMLQLDLEFEQVLRVSESQVQTAQRCLETGGLKSKLHGRSGLVVRVSSDTKLRAIELLLANGISVLDFESRRVSSWN